MNNLKKYMSMHKSKKFLVKEVKYIQCAASLDDQKVEYGMFSTHILK